MTLKINYLDKLNNSSKNMGILVSKDTKINDFNGIFKEKFGSAKLEDELIVFTSVVSLSKTSLVMKQDVKRHDDLVAEAEVCLVAVNMKGKPTKIPEELKKLF